MVPDLATALCHPLDMGGLRARDVDMVYVGERGAKGCGLPPACLCVGGHAHALLACDDVLPSEKGPAGAFCCELDRAEADRDFECQRVLPPALRGANGDPEEPERVRDVKPGDHDRSVPGHTDARPPDWLPTPVESDQLPTASWSVRRDAKKQHVPLPLGEDDRRAAAPLDGDPWEFGVCGGSGDGNGCPPPELSLDFGSSAVVVEPGCEVFGAGVGRSPLAVRCKWGKAMSEVDERAGEPARPASSRHWDDSVPTP